MHEARSQPFDDGQIAHLAFVCLNDLLHDFWVCGGGGSGFPVFFAFFLSCNHTSAHKHNMI